jgi:hypothetical protein
MKLDEVVQKLIELRNRVGGNIEIKVRDGVKINPDNKVKFQYIVRDPQFNLNEQDGEKYIIKYIEL